MKLSLLLLLGTAAVLEGLQCNVPDDEKIDCGVVGTTKDECDAKGCCWVPVSGKPNGVPWCFVSADPRPSCFNLTSAQVPFSDEEMAKMRSYFLSNINIQGLGGVVAAPDYSTPGGSYYYHWQRDGALTMRTLFTTGSFNETNSYMQAFVGWVERVQNEKDPNQQDVRTEPKYELPNGEVYTGAWCRPQNDGPALQATTLINYANALIANGQMEYVKQHLWTGSGNGGAIKFDLDYVANGGWQEDTCDLWEEVRSPDFFWNRINMKKAMLIGAKFAQTMGDQSTANNYLNVAAAINSTLQAHYQGNFVYESTNRPRDSAVIVGFNDGFWAEDGMFSPVSLEVASTIKTLNQVFCNEYSVNQADTNNGVPGILYGRYPGDSYAGGNPWILLTAALGQLFYRGATQLLETNAMPSEQAMSVWRDVLQLGNRDVGVSELAQTMSAAGDSVLLRIRYHVKGDDFHLAEQLDKNSGAQISAQDLTWSYAEVLNAMYARQQYYKLSGRLDASAATALY